MSNFDALALFGFLLGTIALGAIFKRDVLPDLKLKTPLVPPFKEDHILARQGYYLADAYANAGGKLEWLIKWPFRAIREIWRRL